MNPMKKMLCICVLAMIGQLAISQTTTKKWKLKKIGLSVGFDRDMINNMDHSMFAKAIKGDTHLDFENITFGKEDVQSMICENPNIRLEATLLPPFKVNSEIRFSLNFIQDRIDAINYWDKQGSSLYFDTNTDELSAEASLLFKLPLGRSFHLYGGPGMNIGKTFGTTACISGQNVRIRLNETLRDGTTPSDPQFVDYEDYHDCFDLRNSLHTRAFAHFGFGWTLFKRIELGYEWRYGIGGKVTPGAGIHGTTLNSSSFAIRYVIRK